jgi:hypothetical protein
MNNLKTDIFFKSIIESLLDIFNQKDYICNTWIRSSCSKFIIIIYFFSLMDRFKDTELLDWIDNLLLTSVSDYLKNEKKLIEDKKITDCKKKIVELIIIFFRQKIITGELFGDLVSVLDNVVLDKINSITINNENIENLFIKFSKSEINIKKIKQMMNNFYISTVSKQIAFDFLQYFNTGTPKL